MERPRTAYLVAPRRISLHANRNVWLCLFRGARAKNGPHLYLLCILHLWWAARVCSKTKMEDKHRTTLATVILLGAPSYTWHLFIFRSAMLWHFEKLSARILYFSWVCQFSWQRAGSVSYWPVTDRKEQTKIQTSYFPINSLIWTI